MTNPAPTIMVSSSVHDQKERLEQLDAVLTGFGYTVWMSHLGTVPINPRETAFDSCLRAVENCDVFLGLITGRYGSGRDGDGLSITHREMLRAIELKKLRWFLVDEHVDVARQVLKQYRPQINEGALAFEKTPVLEDIRVLDMYEAAMRHDTDLSQREGNWVQSFRTTSDLLRYVGAQFSDLSRIKALLAERSHDQENS